MRLDVFSQKKLHEALTEGGYDVSLRTVRRWIEGEAQPNSAWSRAILEVLDIAKEAPRPEWAEGLATKADIDAMIETLIPVVLDRAERELRKESGPLPPGAPAPDTGDLLR